MLLGFLAIAIAMLAYVIIKIFKPPRVYYAPGQPASELVSRLSCPSCRSRRLRVVGQYTITCEDCGFTFSVGALRVRR